jgi:hypothetical protein
VVGDSPNNSSAQFRTTRQFDDGIPTFTAPPVNDPYTVTLLKIEPVTFEGFFPISIRRNNDPLYVGQTLTVAGYGYVSNNIYPREAYEVQLQVEIVNATMFLAAAPGAGL